MDIAVRRSSAFRASDVSLSGIGLKARTCGRVRQTEIPASASRCASAVVISMTAGRKRTATSVGATPMRRKAERCESQPQNPSFGKSVAVSRVVMNANRSDDRPSEAVAVEAFQQPSPPRRGCQG